MRAPVASFALVRPLALALAGVALSVAWAASSAVAEEPTAGPSVVAAMASDGESADGPGASEAPVLAGSLADGMLRVSADVALVDAADGVAVEPVVGSFTVDGLTYAVVGEGQVALVAVSPRTLAGGLAGGSAAGLASASDGGSSGAPSGEGSGSGVPPRSEAEQVPSGAASPSPSPEGASSDGVEGEGASEPVNLEVPESVEYDGAAYSVTSIGPRALAGCDADVVTIPATVESVDELAFRGSAVAAIEVADGNPSFSSYDGMLFDADQTSLLLIPEGKQGAARIPKTASSVPPDALSHCASVTSVEVEAGSAAYYSENGCLYDVTDETLLWEVPRFADISRGSMPKTSGMQEAVVNQADRTVTEGTSFVNIRIVSSDSQHGLFQGRPNYGEPSTTFDSGGIASSYCTSLRASVSCSTYKPTEPGSAAIGTARFEVEISGVARDFSVTTTASSGYTFKGWSLTESDKTGSSDLVYTQAPSPAPIASPPVVYAIFAPIDYDIEYALDGGYFSPDTSKKTYTIADDDFKLDRPYKSGCVFRGWEVTGASGTGVVTGWDPDFPTRSSTTVRKGTYGKLKARALWLEGTAQAIMVSTNDYSRGTFVGRDNYGEPDGITGLHTVGMWTGYCTAARTLVEYRTETVGSGADARKRGCVRFRTEINHNLLDYTAYTEAKAGYEFAGWSADATDSEGEAEGSLGDVGPKKDSSDPIRLYAIFAPIDYDIEYALDGGYFSPDTSKKTYTIADDDFKLDRPYKSGCVFRGWEVTGASGTGVVTGWDPDFPTRSSTTVRKGTYGKLKARALWLEGTAQQAYFRCDPTRGYFQGQENYQEPYAEELSQVTLRTGECTAARSLFDCGTEEGDAPVGTVRIRTEVAGAARDYGGRALARPGYRFVGWSDDPDAEAGMASGSFERSTGKPDDEPLVLYALFQPMISVDAPFDLGIRMDVLGVESPQAGRGRLVSRSGAPLEVAEVSCDPISAGVEALFGWGDQDLGQVSLTVVVEEGGATASSTARPRAAGLLSFALDGPSSTNDAELLSSFALPGGWGSELPLAYGIAMPPGYAVLAGYPQQSTAIAKLTYTVRAAP